MKDPNDDFPALSGLADEFQRVMDDTYNAGIWSGDLIRSLNWRRWPSKEAEQANFLLGTSWGWAAFTGKNERFLPTRNELAAGLIQDDESG